MIPSTDVSSASARPELSTSSISVLPGAYNHYLVTDTFETDISTKRAVYASVVMARSNQDAIDIAYYRRPTCLSLHVKKVNLVATITVPENVEALLTEVKLQVERVEGSLILVRFYS